MPIERTAYSCQFKCRRRMVLKSADMVKHEARCLKNPDVRSCATCKHDAKPYVEDYGSHREWVGGGCEKDARGDKNCIINCPVWEKA